jgi:hypothetical protein
MVKVAAPPEDSETPAEETATEAETSESTWPDCNPRS